MQDVNTSYFLYDLQPTHLLVRKSCKWQEDEVLSSLSPEEGRIHGEQNHS
jgi:hypothetical protein